MKTRKIKQKEYEVTGVSTYAHVFTLNVKARNKREALKKARDMDNIYIDPAIAEFQEVLLDEPILVK